LEKNMQQTQA